MVDDIREIDAALFSAIEDEDGSALREALAAGADVEASDNKGNTPLHTAIIIGSAVITRQLLEAGADPNRGCASSHPPLVLAAKLNSPLFRWCCDDAEAREREKSALSITFSLIEHGADVARLGPEAASWAITNSSVATLKALGDAGLDWSSAWPGEEKSDKHITLVDMFLSQALLSGVTTPEVVNFLLARGADPNRSDYGRPLLNCFLARGADLGLAVLKAILAAAPAINATDEQGATALMLAASRYGNGRAEALESLLDARADPFIKDRQGRTVADWAAEIAEPAYLEILRKRGMDFGSAKKQSAVVWPLPAVDLRTGSFLALSAMGHPLSWCWIGMERSNEATLTLVEQRFGWSRSPIGPIPVLKLTSITDMNRKANPYAARHVGKAVLGNLLVLSFAAVLPKDNWTHEIDSTNPRPIFIVSGVFPSEAWEAAQTLAQAQPGWSLVARLEALPMMEDGHQSSVVELQV